MNIRDILKELIKDQDAEIFSKVCKVLQVDPDARTADLEPIDGSADIKRARFQASPDQKTGVMVIPKVGSLVIASFISPTRAWISGVDDPEEILIDSPKVTINGGDKKGLIIAADLFAELEKDVAILKGILQVLNGAPIPEPGSGSPSALQTALKTALAAKSPGNYGDQLLNDKVTHG